MPLWRELADQEYLLLWRKEYAHTALGRAIKAREKDPDFYDFYQTVHADDVTTYPEWEGLFSFAATTQGAEADYLCGFDPDLPLTIVVTSRNDTHVERMEDRTQAFIDGIFHLAEKFKSCVELIIVEWNPPSDRPSMAEEFSFPSQHPFVSCRIVTVGLDIHSRYIWSEAMPLYQMIAKNAGIRRARGQFIVATNIDILFSDALFKQLLDSSREKGCIYRSNRWDVDRKILDEGSVDKMIDAADGLHFQVNYRQGIYPAGTSPDVDTSGMGGVFGGQENTSVHSLHTEACGDFQMLHRDDWGRVRGYSELDAYSFHIDSLFAVTCHHAGMKEVVLPEPHYHIDHTLGVKVKSDSYEINEKKVIKHLALAHLWVLDRLQSAGGGYFQLNDETWGLAGDHLPDQCVSLAGWDTKPIAQKTITQCSPAGASLVMLQDLDAAWQPAADRYISKVWWAMSEFVDQRRSGRPIYIWGAGKRGWLAAASLASFGLEVKGVVHGGSSSPQALADNIPVIKATDFLQRPPADAFVLISSIYADVIRQDLEACGWTEGRDYVIGI